MTPRAPSAAADAPIADSGRLVVATALHAPDDGLVRVSWPRTIWRLVLEPSVHPWSAHWRLRAKAPAAAVIIASSPAQAAPSIFARMNPPSSGVQNRWASSQCTG